jgi:hypothetical protein
MKMRLKPYTRRESSLSRLPRPGINNAASPKTARMAEKRWIAPLTGSRNLLNRIFPIKSGIAANRSVEYYTLPRRKFDVPEVTKRIDLYIYLLL